MTRHYAMAFFATAIILVGLLVGYGIYVNATSSAHVAKMTAAQYFRVGAAPVAFREIAPVIYLPVANVYSSQMSDVHFQIDGTLSRMYVKAGDRVRAGQVLGEVVNNELPAQIVQGEGKISAAEANVARWDGTVRRYQKLVELNAVSRQQVDEAVGNLRAAEGELTAAQAYRDQMAARLGSGQIVAPYDGDILRAYHTQGAIVRAGDSLVMVGDLSSLFIRHNVASKVLEQLQSLTGPLKLAVKSGEIVEKTYASSLTAGNAGGGRDVDIRIAEVAPALNIPAEFRTVVYKISNPAGLLEPGTYYQVKIYGTSKRRVLSIPREAMLGDTDPYVLVVNADGRLAQRKITTGIRDDYYMEVKDGLRENETVVVSGQDANIKPGIKVQVTQAPGGTP